MMRAMRWLFACALWCGCYSPQPQAGGPCANGVCPTGLVCSPVTHTCELGGGIDAPIGDARRDDAPPDGAQPGAITLVQQKSNRGLSGDILSLALPSAPASGHLLVMVGGGSDGKLASVTGG